jgi:hypothetical protein
MPLLKRPAPLVPKRQYHVRIQEPLALKMERYADFLGAANIDHIIGGALDFVFKKDTDFNAWLAEHPEGSESVGPKSVRRRAKTNGTGAALDAPETDRANAGSTI